MKRILAILLALAMLTLSACGSGDTTPTVDPLDPWSRYTTYPSLNEAIASLNPTGVEVTVVDTTDADAMAALELDFELVPYDALYIDPALVSEATLLRQTELNTQNVYVSGGYLLFAKDVTLPVFYIEPETFCPHPAYSARIDEDSYRVYPMRNDSFVTRYKEWTNETHAELLITASEQPDLAEAALATAAEAAILLRSFDNRPPISGEVYTAALSDYPDLTVSYMLPDEWVLGVDVQSGTNTVAFFHKASVENDASGLIFSLVLTEDASLGEVIDEVDGLFLVAVYPTEPQYLVSTMASYLDLQAMVDDILYTVSVE